jgi:hypothetical protein
MRTKIFALSAALLLALLVLNAPVSYAQQGSAASEKGTGFMNVAQVFVRLANVLDNVKSLPNVAVDFINALCAVTLSKEAITDLCTFPCGFLEMGIIMYAAIFIGLIPSFIILLISMFLPLGIGMLWGFPVYVIMFVGLSLIGMIIGIIIAGRLDEAIGLSGMCGGICSSIYFALTPLWQLLSKIIAPILEVVSMVFPLFDMAIDNFMSLIAKPCVGFSDLCLRELYRA